MNTPDRLRASLTGFVAGLAGGLFGVGGGILLVPMLTGFFALTQHQAHGTSLAAIGATAIAGLVVYGTHGHVDWVTAATLGFASVFFARLGARGAARVSRSGLTQAFAVFLLVVAIRLFWKVPAGEGHALFTGPLRLAVALAVGASVGLLSGFLGVGGGILAVPALTLLFGAPQQTAQGTSLAVILVTAPFGALEHHRHGNVVPRLVPWLALGAAAGAPLASMVAQTLPQAALARAFAVFLVANAAYMWVRAARAATKA
ncbi:MAG: sulfite exporter TauE/SafE family protein [Candidatus Eisenbacteria bacterium]|uniref:Probable membrane transporter protein n=1 Tax=Eiseniibacteriota bacterium TaxID=2212470 RepID=A0A933SFF9_UNCEI|nr:sulfite exporter TauE/SafE family protein [Candidatus Eisenbacteria bacterium]